MRRLTGFLLSLLLVAAVLMAVAALDTGLRPFEPAAPRPSAAPPDPFAFFSGAVASQGTVQPLIGPDRPFTATLDGTVAGDELTIVERFAFPTGRFEQRWMLKRSGDRLAGRVVTQRGDGEMHPSRPVTGRFSGGGLVLSYSGFAPGGGDTLLGFRHLMRPAGADVTNDVTVTRFGLVVARSRVRFSRAADGTATAGPAPAATESDHTATPGPAPADRAR